MQIINVMMGTSITGRRLVFNFITRKVSFSFWHAQVEVYIVYYRMNQSTKLKTSQVNYGVYI